jgi:DNA polymerase-3 subunit alpha
VGVCSGRRGNHAPLPAGKNPKSEAPKKEIMTPREAAEYLSVHVRTIYRLAKNGNIPGREGGWELEIQKGMSAIAVTDHGALYGIIEFYKNALKIGIKPIIGMEGYTTNVDMRVRPERGKFQNFHLLLLAKDKVGYQNLMKLSSLAHLGRILLSPTG